MEQMAPRRLQVTIRPEWEGRKISAILRYQVGMSGTVMRRIKWLEDGIRLDGQRAHTNIRVQAGQVLDVLIGDVAVEEPFPAVEGPLDIVYEDRDILVIDKQAGVSVHPGPGHYDDTLGNFILWHYRTTGEPANLHPVHRLDKGTSGLILTAKHPFAQDKLRLQLHSNEFRRSYLAVCEGVLNPPCGTFDQPIGRCEDSIQKRQVRPDGDRACTHYETLKVCGARSLLKLTLDTGRTHQIRVHLSAAGHPLVGDFLYGREDHGVIGRSALHSAELSVLHPVTGQRLEWVSHLPSDMARLVR